MALPNVPFGHRLQLPRDPLVLYCPIGHRDPVDVVTPMPHTYPALAMQLPEQLDVVSPVALPKRPCGHGEHTP